MPLSVTCMNRRCRAKERSSDCRSINGIGSTKILKKCIEAGNPTLSEKPFTRTMEEAEELLALYRERRVPCMIGFTDGVGYMDFLCDIYANSQMTNGNVFYELILLLLCLKLHDRATSWMGFLRLLTSCVTPSY